jgi:short subunit dehydrogenase-like uncharacterized protein
VIVLYGATGFTGRIVAAELVERGLETLVAGRDAVAVGILADSLGVEGAAVAADDAAGLHRLFSRARVVVSCAGPFGVVGRPIALGAVAAGAHYADCTGEPQFMRWAYRELDPLARRAGVCAVPASGFDYVPADAAASLLLRRLGPLRRLDYIYRSESTRSAGTRRSALAVLGDGGYVVRDGCVMPARAGERTRRVTFSDRRVEATPVPLGDPLCALRRLGVEEATSWTAAGPIARRALRVGAPALRVGAVRSAAAMLAAGRGGGPTLEQRQTARFVIRVEGVGRLRGHAAVELRGTDSYAVTARALAVRAERLLAGTAGAGVVTPAEGLDATRTLHVLGIDVRET